MSITIETNTNSGFAFCVTTTDGRDVRIANADTSDYARDVRPPVGWTLRELNERAERVTGDYGLLLSDRLKPVADDDQVVILRRGWGRDTAELMSAAEWNTLLAKHIEVAKICHEINKLPAELWAPELTARGFTRRVVTLDWAVYTTEHTYWSKGDLRIEETRRGVFSDMPEDNGIFWRVQF